MSEQIILYDGWGLAYSPNGPAAIHLNLLWDFLTPQVRPVVALPAPSFDLLPDRVDRVILETPPTPAGRLFWEQRLLNRLAKKTAASVVHLTSGGPSFLRNCPQVISPAGYLFSAELGGGEWEIRSPVTQHSLAARFRTALLPFNLERSHWTAWPDDLPDPEIEAPLRKMPVILPSLNWQDNNVDLGYLNLPESFVLYHGPTRQYDLRRLLDAWSWAAPAVGQDIPLVMIGFNPAAQQCLAELAADYQLQDTLQALPHVPFAALLEVYRRSSALFHPTLVSPWGDPLTLALSFHKPVVALENRWSDQRLGPAAYLIRRGDTLKATSRSLGAALVTVLVEEQVADGLAEQAAKRAARWRRSAAQIPELIVALYATS